MYYNILLYNYYDLTSYNIIVYYIAPKAGLRPRALCCSPPSAESTGRVEGRAGRRLCVYHYMLYMCTTAY